MDTFILVRKRTHGRRHRSGGRLQKLVANVFHRPGCRHIPTQERMDRDWAYTYDVSSETTAAIERELRHNGTRVQDRPDLRPCGACKPTLNPSSAGAS